MAVNKLDDIVLTGDVSMSGADNVDYKAGSITNASINASAGIERTKLEQNALAEYTIPLYLLRTHDDYDAVLPETAADDDLGFTEGTFGTTPPLVHSVDFGGTTTTAYARVMFPLPAEYDDGETVNVVVWGGMNTTVSDTSATIDVECYECETDGTLNGSPTDLCSTAAQSINSLTHAAKSFTITPTGLVAGDVLDIRLTFAGTDSGDAGVMKGELTRVSVKCDIRG